MACWAMVAHRMLGARWPIGSSSICMLLGRVKRQHAGAQQFNANVQPATMDMHVAGHEEAVRSASNLRNASQETATPLQASATSPPAADGNRIEGIDIAAIARIHGREGPASVDQMSATNAERISLWTKADSVTH